MFEKLRRRRLRKNPRSMYATKQMDRVAKKAGYRFLQSYRNPYYINELDRSNIRGNAIRVTHYLHCECTSVGQFNETICVALFPDGEIISSIHMVGNCALCKYIKGLTQRVALKVIEERKGPRGYGTHIRA